MPKVLDIRKLRFKVPEEAIYVGRSVYYYHLPASKWSNPFVIQCVAMYRDYATKRFSKEELEELRGKDLVCWCHEWDGIGTSPDYCHADVLLELANA